MCWSVTAKMSTRFSNQKKGERRKLVIGKMAAEKVETMQDSEATGVNQQDCKIQDTLSSELLIKHPLQNKWTLWFFRNNKSKTWEENLCEVTSFDTVEDFWALYNHIEAASRLQIGCDYCLFKHGVKPMWEDEKNRHGGRWLLSIQRGQRMQDVDDFWLETLLCLIGEAFDEQGDEICGAVINIRKAGNKIAIWTGDYRKEEYIKKIGRKLKERLSIPDNMSIAYQSHEDVSSKTGSAAKVKFTV